MYTPFLLKNLGQEEYGLYSLIIAIVGYLSLLDMGFGNAIVRFTLEYKAKNESENLYNLYGLMSLMYLLIGLTAFIVCAILFFSTELIFGNSMSSVEINKIKIMILISGVNLLFSFPLQIASSILIAYEKFIFKNLIGLLKIVLVPITMVFFIILFDFKSVELIVIVSIFNFLTFLMYYLYAYKKLDFKLSFNSIDLKLFKSILTFSSSMLFLMIFEQIQLSSGQFVIGMFSGTKDVAIWGIAMILVLNFRALSTSITNVFSPSLISATINGNIKEMNHIVNKMTRIQSYVLCLTVLNFVLFGYEFIVLWAGQNYKDVYLISLYIIIPMAISQILDFSYIIQIAYNKLKFRIITLFCSFFFAFLIIYLLSGLSLTNYSMIISLSIILGNLIFVLYYTIFILKYKTLSLFRNLAKIFFSSLLITVLFRILEEKSPLFSYNNNYLLNYILKIVSFNVLILINYWVICFSNEEKKMFNVFRK